MTAFDLPQPPEIEVLTVQSVSSAGGVRAFVTLRLGAIVIRGCTVTQQPGRWAEVSLPQAQTGDSGGPPVEILDPRLFALVRAVVLGAWGDHPHTV